MKFKTAKRFLTKNAWKITRMKIDGTFKNQSRFGRKCKLAKKTYLKKL